MIEKILPDSFFLNLLVLRYEHGIGKPLAKSDCHHNVKDKMGVAAVNFYLTYETPKYFVFDYCTH